MKRGFTLTEVVVVVTVIGILVGALGAFESNIFKQNTLIQNGLLADQDARQTMRAFIALLRAAAPADTGAYAIAEASSQSFTFFSDVDKDGTHEQVRYFLSGNTLQRGLLKPTGSPLAYNPAAEATSTVVNGLTDSAQIIFTYYDKNYAGTTTPLTLPVNIPSIRLVKLSLKIDADPNQPPGPTTYVTQVMIRSLKDNL